MARGDTFVNYHDSDGFNFRLIYGMILSSSEEHRALLLILMENYLDENG